MTTLQSPLAALKQSVIKDSKNPNFIHHEWFADYHLKFVEQISMELCDVYTEADRNLVTIMVWMHDYPKILDKAREHDPEMLPFVRQKLQVFNFEESIIQKTLDYLSIFERKMEIDLREAPIEVQIVSSADAAAHLVGPFWSIYWKENSSKLTVELMESNRLKLKQDWERKITLPEIKLKFQERYNLVSEQAGNFPDKFL